MAKNLKLNIKNTQLAEALQLDKFKKKKDSPSETPSKATSSKEKEAETPLPGKIPSPAKPPISEKENIETPPSHRKEEMASSIEENLSIEKIPETRSQETEKQHKESEESPSTSSFTRTEKHPSSFRPIKKEEDKPKMSSPVESLSPRPTPPPGPVDDFRRPKIIRKRAPDPAPPTPSSSFANKGNKPVSKEYQKTSGHSPRPSTNTPSSPSLAEKGNKGGPASPFTKTHKGEEEADPFKEKGKQKETEFKQGPFKDYKEVRSQRKPEQNRSFDTRDRLGLRESEEDRWRKKRAQKKGAETREELTIRPKTLSVQLPISVKDLAIEMKLKASQLISKLFMQGLIATINDILDDETVVQLLGHEFGCEISIDTVEQKRIKITDKTIKEEIAETDPDLLSLRPPVITFMGHVDHGKTSLIDAIRKTNLAAGEAGAITQHIGAFKCVCPVGEITILDTPGHEAFSAMRERGAIVTDLVVLVVAGDEGMRDQTLEALNKAKEAQVPILVALNKCDKPAFNAENVYRQLSEHELLPEVWGGKTITVNCSAKTGEGISDLLEMLSLQSEVLELRANPSARARGSVIESAMHKGLGAVTTVLVQNGTLRRGDTLVFDLHYAKVKTMHDEYGKEILEAPPSTPVKLTGLSGLPEAGSEFIAVKNEKEAKEISEARQQKHKHQLLQKGKKGLEGLLESKALSKEKKTLNLILRADVQGSLEALHHSLQKIQSDKIDLFIVSKDVGQISESDVELAAASKATIIGFHTKVESHAEGLIKAKKVIVKLHNIIYHAVDEIREIMRSLLDKIPQENEMGKAEIKALFKSSQLGLIAGCQVLDGMIKRSNYIRVMRKGTQVWKGPIASLKKMKDDVKEVTKGFECGIVLQGFSQYQVGDLLEAFEITYLEQEL